jgi:hypothetical protein
MESDTTRTRFVERIFRLRVFGLALGFFAVAGVLWQDGADAWTWTLLAINGFLWPHLARQLALSGADPERTEVRNLLVDSAMGGVWIALMRFNVVPSMLLLVMLAVDKISVGGWRLLGRAFALQVAACERFRVRARELDGGGAAVAAIPDRLSARDQHCDVRAGSQGEPPQSRAREADAPRRIDRYPEPAQLGVGSRQRAQALQAWRRRAGAADARHRSLQGHQ